MQQGDTSTMSIRPIWRRKPQSRLCTANLSSVFIRRFLVSVTLTLLNALTIIWFLSLRIASLLSFTEIAFVGVLFSGLAVTLARMWYLTSTAFARWMRSSIAPEEWSTQPKPK
jgi:threonine/homoserine/homoserine lactone efflux protein